MLLDPWLMTDRLQSVDPAAVAVGSSKHGELSWLGSAFSWPLSRKLSVAGQLGVTTIWILPPWSSMTELIHNFKLPPSATFFIQTRSTGIDQIVSAPVFPSRLCAVVRIIRFEFFWKNAAWDRQEKKIKSCWNFFLFFFLFTSRL